MPGTFRSWATNSKARVLAIGGIAGSAIAIALAATGGGGGGGAGTANLWVDSNGGTCTRSASTVAYNDAAACSSFNAAYTAAQAGDTVYVKGGSYGAQTLNATGKSSGSNVLIAEAPGETVTSTGTLNVYTKRVTIQGIDFGSNDTYIGVCCGEGNFLNNQQVPDLITLDGVKARNMRIFSATNVTVKNSDYGPSSSCGGAYGGENNKVDNLSVAGITGAVAPTGITLQNNVFHDVQTWSVAGQGDGTGGDCHSECLALFGLKDINVIGNTFYNCSIYDIFIKDNGGTGFSGTFRFENNSFGQCHNFHIPFSTCSTLAFCTHPVDTYIVNNSFQGQGSFTDCSVEQTIAWKMQGNYGDQQFDVCSFASTQVTYSYNAWRNRSACTGTGNLGSVSNYFVSDAADTEFNHNSDLHITAAATPLLGKIPVASSVMSSLFDIDGDARTDPYDIGADER